MTGMTFRKLLVTFLLASLSCAAQQASQPPKPAATSTPPPAEATTAAEPELDLPALAKETEKVDMHLHKIGIFWWVPPDYWLAALRQQGYNAEQAHNVLQPFRQYNLFIVGTGDLGVGDVSWVKEPEVKKNLLLRDQHGNKYKPMEEVPADIGAIIEVMKPIFKNMMGNLGGGLQFMVFPLKDGAGNVFADARKESEIFLDVSDLMGPGTMTYTWRFPLTALVPAKYCPAGKEKVEANWKYCPWHGVKLSTDPEAQPAATPVSHK